MAKKYHNKKFIIVSIMVMIILLLPMLTFFPDMPQGVDIQTDSLTSTQTVEDGWEIAVNWGSRILSPPEESISSLTGNPDQNGTAIAVNWASSVTLPLPPRG